MNKMKNGIIIIGILLMLLQIFAVNAEYEYISEGDILTASLVNQDPDPAIAGNMVELRIGVENWGSKAADGYDVELVMDYPFVPIAGEEYIKSTGALVGFQTEDDQKIIKFKVKTDREASEGSYEFDVLLYKPGEKGSAAIKKTLSVDLKNRESAEVIYIDKVQLVPGEQTPVEFTINNVGSAPLRDLSFSWENEDEIILPVGSSDTKYVKYLGIGESTTITYDVMADTNADAGLYKLTLSLTYDDPITGDITEISNNAGIYVGGGTDFDISFSENSNGEISFSVSNIGSNPANSVSVIIPEQNGWKVSGSNSAIIGNLDNGDYTIASFSLNQIGEKMVGESTDRNSNIPTEESESKKIQNTRETSNNVNVQIDYTDTMGTRKTVVKEVKLNMGTSSVSEFGGSGTYNGMRQQRTNTSSSLTTPIIILVIMIVVVVGFVMYNRRKKLMIKKK